MDPSQRADLLAFVRDDGKGFVGGHSALDTFRTSPMTRHLPATFTIRDEIHQASRHYSRDTLDVLMRLDERTIDLGRRGVKRTDRDFAVAWARTYGKGRMFWTTFGHLEDVYDDPRIQQLYTEAIKWAIGLTDYDPKPHPKPSG